MEWTLQSERYARDCDTFVIIGSYVYCVVICVVLYINVTVDVELNNVFILDELTL
jgi:hypothetical protein